MAMLTAIPILLGVVQHGYTPACRLASASITPPSAPARAKSNAASAAERPSSATPSAQRA